MFRQLLPYASSFLRDCLNRPQQDAFIRRAREANFPNTDFALSGGSPLAVCVRSEDGSPPLSDAAKEYHTAYSLPGDEGTPFYAPNLSALQPSECAEFVRRFPEGRALADVLHTPATPDEAPTTHRKNVGLDSLVSEAAPQRSPTWTDHTFVIGAGGVSIAEIDTRARQGFLGSAALGFLSAVNPHHVEPASHRYWTANGTTMRDYPGLPDTRGRYFGIGDAAAAVAEFDQATFTGAHRLTRVMPCHWQVSLKNGDVHSFCEGRGGTRYGLAHWPELDRDQATNEEYIQGFIEKLKGAQALALLHFARAGTRAVVLPPIVHKVYPWGLTSDEAKATEAAATRIGMACAEHLVGLLQTGGTAHGFFDVVVSCSAPPELSAMAADRPALLQLSTADAVVDAIRALSPATVASAAALARAADERLAEELKSKMGIPVPAATAPEVPPATPVAATPPPTHGSVAPAAPGAVPPPFVGNALWPGGCVRVPRPPGSGLNHWLATLPPPPGRGGLPAPAAGGHPPQARGAVNPVMPAAKPPSSAAESRRVAGSVGLH